VTVFEAREKPGGLNEYGLAAYKMLGDRAAKEVKFILGIGGITLKNNSILGDNIQLSELRRNFDAVFLGLGHNAVNQLGLEDEGAVDVHNAVDFIVRIRQEDLSTLPVGRRVVVIGGGNTAIDIAVQVRKLGAEYVTLVYRRGPKDMGATDHEQEIAQNSGVLIKTWARPMRLETGDSGITGVTFEYTRRSAQGGVEGTGEYFRIEADQVFKAIGQMFSDSPLQADEMPEAADGRIRVDAERRTSLPGVWAGGDCVAGRDLTVVAVQDGKLAAESIHRALAAAESED
jgi:glutamate synthase (NADPH/NADH) small chain